MNVLLTTLDAARLQAFTEAGFWRGQTVYDSVVDHARDTPDKIAIRERVRTATYSELVDAADRLSAAWEAQGLAPGERVAVWLPSRIEVAVATLACSRSGLVICPSLHRDHTVADIAELVQQMRATAIVAQTGYGADARGDEIVAALAHCDRLKSVRFLAPSDTEAVFGDVPAGEARPPKQDPNSVVYLAFTSGTTGLPKGVMHSDNTLLAPTRAMAKDWALDRGSCVYSLSPLSHNLGFGAMLLAMSVGAEFVIHDLPRGASLAERLFETRANFAYGVPTHAIDLLGELRDTPGRKLPDLRGFRISGAAVPPVVAQGLLDVGIVPQSGYGMTEAGSTHYTLPDTEPELIVNSVGRACEAYEVRIFDREDTERILPAGEVGQIGGRGASLMLGYFDEQEATERSFNAAGWFLTGDLGWMDESGFLRITGRKKDVIIRGGHNIFPAKIENLALRHPSVAKAAAVPVPDERLGEKVCMIVQPVMGRHLNGPELLVHLAESGLSKYDMPEYFATFESLPLTPSGKILKSALLDHIREGRIAPEPVRFTQQ